MMKNEKREAKSAFWLQHLRECAVSGENFSVYAQRRELDVDEGYRWTRILRRAGLWPVKQKADCGAASALVARKSAQAATATRITTPGRAVMMRPYANVAVYVCVMRVDMRKQASTLALLVEQALKKNIFEPGLYVFSNHRRDRIKIV